MKMTRKDYRNLVAIMEDLERGQRYIMSDNTAVCRWKDRATTTLDLQDVQGHVWTPIAKDIGSELTLLHNGVSRLRRTLEAVTF